MTRTYQSDIKVSLPNDATEKNTITLSSTGDIQLITGRNKLVTQLMRTIINDETVVRSLLNTNDLDNRTIKSLFTTLLRYYRTKQIKYINRTDPDLTGFSVWRKAAGTDDEYVRISDTAIVEKFTDNTVENNITYSYGISKVFQNVFESSFLDTFDITPSIASKDHLILTGKYSTFMAGNRRVTVYVDYNKLFRASEILDKILGITVTQVLDDPRNYSVSITVQDALGSKVNVSTIQKIPIKGV